MMKQNIKLAAVLALVMLSCSIPASAEVSLHAINVRRGDTLHDISHRYMNDPSRWPEIYRYNSSLIKDPNLILPDMKIYVPVELIKEEFLNAFVVDYRNDVRLRRKDSLKWENIGKGDTIYVGDTIRTAVNSYISIKFEGQSSVRIGENSFVLMKNKKILSNELDLKAGKVRANNVRVLCYDTLVSPHPDKENDFVAEVLDDMSAKVSVLKGSIDVASNGTKITLDEGEAVRVDVNKGPGKVLALVADNIGDQVGILVEQDKYRLEVSPENNFSEILHRKEYSVDSSNRALWDFFCRTEIITPVYTDFADFLYQAFSIKPDEVMPDGIYFWRLVFDDTLGLDRYSDTLSFRIDSSAPRIDILLPKSDNVKTGKEMFLLKGTVSEDAEVTVNGIAAEQSDLNFFIYIRLYKGENLLKISAKDQAGNSTTATRSINYIPRD